VISLSQIRQAAKTKPEDEDVVELLQHAVIELWESATGLLWDKRLAHVEEFFVDPGQRTLRLSLRPVLQIVQVRERGSPASSWEPLAVAEWQFAGSGELRRLGVSAGGLWSWESSVQVTYDGGYDEFTCPRDVQLALITQARFMTERNSDGKLIVKNQAFEGGSGSLHEADLHPLFQATANRRRKKF